MALYNQYSNRSYYVTFTIMAITDREELHKEGGENKKRFGQNSIDEVIMYGNVHQSPKTSRGYAPVLPYAHGCAVCC